jgi:hypothetical protein
VSPFLRYGYQPGHVRLRGLVSWADTGLVGAEGGSREPAAGGGTSRAGGVLHSLDWAARASPWARAQTLGSVGRSRFDSAALATYRMPRLGLRAGSPGRTEFLPTSPAMRSSSACAGCGRGWCGKPPGLTLRSQPRNVTRVAPETSRKAVNGARPLLENSTACRKSVPTTPSGSVARSRDHTTLATDSFGTTSDKLVKTSDHAVSDGTS